MVAQLWALWLDLTHQWSRNMIYIGIWVKQKMFNNYWHGLNSTNRNRAKKRNCEQIPRPSNSRRMLSQPTADREFSRNPEEADETKKKTIYAFQTDLYIHL